MKIPLLILCLVIATLPGWAAGFLNGDFKEGRHHWEGDCRVVLLKADDTIDETTNPDDFSADPTPADPAAPPADVPIIAIKLNPGETRRLFQHFTTDPGTGVLKVKVVYRGSDDFKRSDKAAGFTPDITWKPGSIWYWSDICIPRVDITLRLDKYGFGYSYKLGSLKKGQEWQTLTVAWDSVGPDRECDINVLAPPGTGTLYVKSVSVSK